MVHLARTTCLDSKDVKDESAVQPPSKAEHQKPLKSVQDIQEIWVADHAKHVGIHMNLYKGALQQQGAYNGQVLINICIKDN